MRPSLETCSSLAGLLQSRAQQEPDRVAFRFLADGEGDERTLTYGALDRRARALAACLQARGAAGQRALLLHPAGLEYVEALFACFYAGVVAVPAYPPRPGRSLERLRTLLADSRPRFALTTAAAREQLSEPLAREPELAGLTWLTPESAAEEGAPAVAPWARADDLALLQYTSGSTGSPRGVMLSQAHLLRNAAAICARFGATREDRLVSWLPPYHDMGLVGAIVAPLVAGGEATLLPPSVFLLRPLCWLRAISRFRATISGGPDSAYDLCVRRAGRAQREPLDLSSWRVAFDGAERVRPETWERFAAAYEPAGFRRGAFSACYGLAEATLAVSIGAPDAPRPAQGFDPGALGQGRAAAVAPGAPGRALAASGVPIEGTEVAVADPQSLRRRGPGEVGELWVRGPCVAAGYWGQPEASERTFRARLAGEEQDAGGWLRTGDLGFLHDGEVFVTGRIKDLLILLGVNHYPEDLEATACRADARLRPGGAAAFAVEGEAGEQLVLVLEVASPREAPAAELVSAVRSAVAAEHELPVREVVLVPPGAVPRTSSGKVQRSRCRELYLAAGLEVLARSGSAPAGLAPAPPALVGQVAALAAGLLGLERLEPDDDFFALGGHSLLATQLASRVGEAFEVELPLRAVFEARTPAALAARVAAAERRPPPPPPAPVGRSGPLQLSPSQERMWFLQQLEPQGTAYNVAGAVALDGPLDAAALERALAEVVQRHEVLRSNYPAVEGAPRVAIAPARELPLPVIDLSADPQAERRAVALASELARLPFDLARDALLRVRLFRTGEERHVLAVSLHHVVVDGWSLGLLLSALLDAYAALAAGRAPALPLAPLQVVDYAAWQRERLGGEALRPHLAWWREKLAGAPVLELPSDRPRAGHRTTQGALVPLALPEGLLEALRARAQAEGATPFMLLLAAFAALLHRTTGATDLVIGTPIANRNRLAAEGQVGSLVNTLPLRLAVDPERPFAALLRATREAALEAFAHQDLPFDRLVAEVGAPRRQGGSPLFSVLFDFQNAPMPAQRAGALHLRYLPVSRGASQVDLSLLVGDNDLTRQAGIEYSTELFDEATIRRLAGHYLTLLEGVAADPQVLVSRLPLLRRAEREELLARAAAACRGSPARTPVHLSVAAQARRTPDAPAVLDDQGALSYRELEAAASALAARLRGLGAGPGERVAVLLERSRAAVVALLAILKAGAAYLPVDPRYPLERIHFVLGDAQPALVLAEPGLGARLALPAGFPVIELDAQVLEAVAPGASGPLSGDPDAIAYVLYTSGSSGQPKGVEVPHAALANLLASMAREPGFGAKDLLLSVTTFSFDIAALELWLPLVTGACVRLASSEAAADGRLLTALLRTSGATVMQATPATWRMLVEAGWEGDPRLKILCGGEAFPRALADALLARGSEVWNLYGPTETTVWSAVHRVQPGQGLVPVGGPVDHTRLYVLDAHGEPVPPLVAGEIHIGGAGVARGYLGRPDLTAERFLPDPFAGPDARMYRTGDGGRFRSDGALECLARLDAQVKLRGHRIEPGEVEATLRTHPGVADVAVAVREDQRGDPQLVAWFVPREGAGATPGELRRLCQDRLPTVMVPGALVPLERLPRTPNGKLDRAALPAPGPQPLDETPPLAPRDELEAALLRVWEEVLQVPVPGVRHDFFALGGHSLLAVRLLARIERELGVALPLRALVGGATIEQLAQEARALRAPVAAAPPGGPEYAFLVPVRGGGPRAPVICVHGGGGHALNLNELARHLDPDRPLWALEARGLDGVSAPFETVEEMAAAYLAELRLLQPRGPYLIAGYCGGGIVAFEMARRLRADGEAVGFLALIDCLRPGAGERRSRMRRWWHNLAVENAEQLVRRVVAAHHRDVGVLRQLFRVFLHRLKGERVPVELRDAWLLRSFVRAVRRYPLQAYAGRLHVFKARDADLGVTGVGPDLGWSGLAAGGVVALEVPGDHHSLLREPAVLTLAAGINAGLRLAEAGEGAAGSASAHSPTAPVPAPGLGDARRWPTRSLPPSRTR